MLFVLPHAKPLPQLVVTEELILENLVMLELQIQILHLQDVELIVLSHSVVTESEILEL